MCIPPTPELLGLFLGIKKVTGQSSWAPLSLWMQRKRFKDIILQGHLFSESEELLYFWLIIKFIFMIIITKGKFRVELCSIGNWSHDSNLYLPDSKVYIPCQCCLTSPTDLPKISPESPKPMVTHVAHWGGTYGKSYCQESLFESVLPSPLPPSDGANAFLFFSSLTSQVFLGGSVSW